jgi:hypothetical protein
MKKITKVFLLAVLALLLGVFIFMDFMEDFEESFRIEGVDFSLFEVASQQDSYNCYVLKEATTSFDSAITKSYLIGIRFKPEFISLKREHLWDNNRMALGAMGHIDSITDFSIQGTSNEKMNNSCFLEAARFKDFHITNWASMERHHMGEGNCLVAQTYASVNDFWRMYNRNSDTVNRNINDYLLFKVPDSLVNKLIKEKAKLTLKFSDGRSVQAYMK